VGHHLHTWIAGREATLLLLASFLVAFAGTRLYTRLARRHGWRSGHIRGVHVHHGVVGILLVLLSGTIELALRPSADLGHDLLAIVFGAGAALTLDEFALAVHLRDVYWTAEGRSSVEAILMFIVLDALLLVGLSPFGINDGSELPRAIAFTIVACSVALTVVACLKGKLLLGLISIFVPPVALVGAVRLARPRSLWAERFYACDPEKAERARARYAPDRSRAERLRMRAIDALAGARDA
jgi:hypothetical protein